MSYNLGSAHGTIELDYHGEHEAERAEEDIEEIKEEAEEASRALRRMGRLLGSVFRTVGKLAAISVVTAGLVQGAVAAAALGVQLLGIVPALASILSLASALPAAITAAVIAAGVLAAALNGVGDAIKAAFSGDAAAFQEALKKLAPAARDFVRAIRDGVPALKELQQGIQQAFFDTGISEVIPKILANVQALRPQLEGVAREFGLIAKDMALFLSRKDVLAFVSKSAGVLKTALQEARKALKPLLQGLLDVGNVGLPLLTQLVKWLGKNAQGFGQWMSQIAKSGQLSAWITEALSVLKDLAGILKAIGGIVSAVFKAAEAAGGGLLKTIKDILKEFSNVAASEAGQEALRSLFAGVLAVATQLAPVFLLLARIVSTVLGPVLLNAAKTIGPALLVVLQHLELALQALAPGINMLAESLAHALVSLAPALPAIGLALGQILKALTPLIPVLASFAALLLTQVASGLAAFASAVGPAIAVFSVAFLKALQKFMPMILQMATQVLPQAVDAGLRLAEAFLPLVPLIIQVGETWLQQLMPHIPKFATMLTERLIPALIRLAEEMGEGMINALLALIPLIPQLVSVFVAALPVIVYLINTLADVAPIMSTLIVAVLKGIAVFFMMTNGAISAGRAIKDGFKFAIEGLIWILQGFPGMAMGAINRFSGMITGFFRGVWATIRNLFSAGVNMAASNARTLPGKVLGAIAGLGGSMRGVVTGAWNAVRAMFSSGVSAAVNIARNLPRQVAALAGQMVSAGLALGRGLLDGIRGMAGEVMSAARNLASQAINAIKSALKIGSPSRVTFEIGAWTTEGFIAGLLSLLRKLEQARDKVTSAITPVVSTAAAGVNPATVPGMLPRSFGQPTTNGAQIIVNNNVQALPGMDAREVATYSTRKMLLALTTGTTNVPLPLPSAGA